MEKQTWAFIGDYLGLPAVFNVKRGVVWQIIQHDNNEDSNNWLYENENNLKENGVPCVNTHRKYPIIAYPVAVYNEFAVEKLIKLGNRACDWYANKWLNNLKIKKLAVKNEEMSLWRIADNCIYSPNKTDFIKLLEPTCVVTVPNDYVVNDYEYFKENAVFNLLDTRHEISDDEREEIITDAYNFSVLEEQESENQYNAE